MGNDAKAIRDGDYVWFGFSETTVPDYLVFRQEKLVETGYSSTTQIDSAKESSLRTYPRNSSEAAARIVALVLIADGHVSRSEELALEKLDISRELDLDPAEFARIVQALCEDHVIGHMPSVPAASHIDNATLDTLLAEIDDRVLRSKIIRLCLAVASADNHLADGEIATLAAILIAWAPQPDPAVNPPDISFHIRQGAAPIICDVRREG